MQHFINRLAEEMLSNPSPERCVNCVARYSHCHSPSLIKYQRNDQKKQRTGCFQLFKRTCGIIVITADTLLDKCRTALIIEEYIKTQEFNES